MQAPPPEIRTVYVDRTAFALPDPSLLQAVNPLRPEGVITILSVQESLINSLGQCNGQLEALQLWARKLDNHNKDGSDEQSE